MSLALTILLAYLAGSVPFGLLIGLARGVDVRTVGSRNIGATNVLRTVGKPWGALAFVLDFAKGVAGAALAPLLAQALLGGGWTSPAALARLAGGLAAVAGHNWPVWLGFRGGKGVATSAGMLVALAPTAVGLAFLLWLAVFLATRYVSLASILAAVALGVLVWVPRFAVPGGGVVAPALLSLLALAVIWRHRANIARLAAGTENRFSFRRKEPQKEGRNGDR